MAAGEAPAAVTRTTSLHEVRRRLRRAIFRLGKRTYLKVWDLLASLQSSKPLQSGFVLWTSPDDVSRRAPDVALMPYLCVLQRKTLMEPRRGLLIADYGVLIETSVSNAYTARDPILWEHFGPPSPLKYCKAMVLRRYRTDLKAVVSLCTAWPSNYFHFYRDFLPKILLLEEANIDPALDVLVPGDLFDQPFFQEAIQSKRLSGWNFIPTRGQFIRSESTVFCSAKQWGLLDRSSASEPEVLSDAAAGTKFLEAPAEVLALLDLEDALSGASPERRIFLTRSGGRGRNLSNYEEIEPLLRERKFESVDTDGMSVREQARLFRECRYLVGIHGAGLVNIIHAYDHDLSLLELRQPGEEHLATEYALMCHSFGFDYREIVGIADPRPPGSMLNGPGNRFGSFRIDVSEFRAAIDNMIMTSSPEPPV
jgi:hypothetical protein